MIKNISRNYLCAILMCLFCQLIFSQNSGPESKFNLPPGAKFAIKKYEKIDYSYKLTQNLNLAIDKKYLKFNNEEFASLKFKDVKAYNYYSKAKDYFDCLSDKVEKSFTVKELWYIYIYDQELKKQLILIK